MRQNRTPANIQGNNVTGTRLPVEIAEAEMLIHDVIAGQSQDLPFEVG